MPDASTHAVYPPSPDSPTTPTKPALETACAVDLGPSGDIKTKTAAISDVPVITGTVAPSTPPQEKPLPPPMYQNTGYQTYPPETPAAFKEVYGRLPTHYESERSLGVAGIGRYKDTGPHPNDVLSSAAFPVPKKPPRATYVDSGFQHKGFEHCRKAITRAKVKAARIAAKLKKVYADDGFKVWGEAREARTIHTEQIQVDVEVDAQGNASEDEVVAGRFLPNIYRNDLDPQRTPSDATHPPCPTATTTETAPRKASSEKSTPTCAPPLSREQLEQLYGPLQPIASVEPADREDTPESAEPEESEEPQNVIAHDFYGWPVYFEDPGPQLPPAYAPDDDDSFVVFDATKAAACAPPRVDVPTGPRGNKRKARGEIREVDEGHRSKRTRSSSPKGRSDRTKDGRRQDDRHERQRSPSRPRHRSPSTDYSRPRSPTRRSRHRSPSSDYSRSPSPARRPRHRELSVARDEKSPRADSWRNDRESRRRSRSPDRSQKDTKKAYRARDTSRQRSNERDYDTRHSARKHDKTESHRHRSPARAHTPQDVRRPPMIEDSTQRPQGPIAMPTPAKEANGTKDVSEPHRRQSRLPKPKAPKQDGPAQLTTNSQQRCIDEEKVAHLTAEHADIVRSREAEDRKREAHNATKDEQAVPRRTQKHAVEETKTRIPTKTSEPPKDPIKEVEPLENIVKQVEPVKKITPGSAATRRIILQGIEPVNKKKKEPRKAPVKEVEKTETSKAKVEQLQKTEAPKPEIEQSQKTEAPKPMVGQPQKTETPKPTVEEPVQKKADTHALQRGSKRSRSNADADDDVTPQKKIKKDGEMIHKAATQDGATKNNERDEKKAVAPPVQRRPRALRPEIQRFVPRALRDAQNSNGLNIRGAGASRRR